jgi:hypothetical protein
MADSCFAIAILPGKTEVLRRFWQAIQGPRAAQNAAHIRRTGITRLLAFLQHTAQGDFLVQYVVEPDNLNAALDRAADSDLAESRWTEQQFQEFSGIDWTNPANRPNLETLFDWTGAGGPGGAETVFAMPVLPGKRTQAEQYWASLRGPQAAEGEARLQRMGIVRLFAALQRRPEGDLLVQYVVTSGSFADALRKAAAADSEYDRWTMQQFREFSGIDWYQFGSSVPDLELLYDWKAT